MHDIVKISVKLNAPIERVWEAITDKTEMKNWYFDILDFEAKEGSSFSFYGGDIQKSYYHYCEVLEIIPYEKLKHTWTYPELSKEKTFVLWELEKDGNETLLRLSHKGLENFKHLGKDFQKESFESGWNVILNESLKNFVEN